MHRREKSCIMAQPGTNATLRISQGAVRYDALPDGRTIIFNPR